MKIHDAAVLSPSTLALVAALVAAPGACAKDDGSGDDGSGSDGSGGEASSESSTSSSTSSGGTSTSSATSTSSSSSSSGSGSSSTTGSDTESGFVTPPDGGVSNMCDVFAQDCPEGQKCTSTGSSNVCVPIAPDAHPPGDPCTRDTATGEDDCELGAICVPEPDPELQRCLSLCTGTAAAPVCEDGTCQLGDGGFTPVCIKTCDPLIQDCDIVGWACYINPGAGDPFGCWPDRTATDSTGDAGATCAFTNSCHAGLFCANASAVAGCTATGCCTPFCDLSDPNATAECPGADMGEECVALFTMTPPPGAENVGACAIPM